MTPEEKAELGKILDAVTVESPVDDFVAPDREFHKNIAVGSGNSVLASLVDNMSLPTARARIWRGMTEPGALERTLAEHRAIHSAILSGDTDLARSWATVHIGGIESWLRTTLTGLGPRSQFFPRSPPRARSRRFFPSSLSPKRRMRRALARAR